MKRFLSLAFILTAIFCLVSCASKEEKIINDLQDIVTLIDEKGDILTDEQWDKTVADYQAIVESVANSKDLNFTDEQKQQIAKLEAKCFGELTKHGAKRVGRSINNMIKEGTNAVKGLLEGLKGDED